MIPAAAYILIFVGVANVDLWIQPQPPPPTVVYIKATKKKRKV